MPVYVYKCPECGVFERTTSIKSHKNHVFCKCSRMAFQVITKPSLVIPKDVRYKSPIDGTLITSEKAAKEDMARNNCIEYEIGIRQDADRRFHSHNNELDKMIDETVDREIALMPTVKRERLESELTNGLTAQVERI